MRENCFQSLSRDEDENCETRNKETLQSHFSSSLQITCRKRSVGKSFRLGENFKLNRRRLIFPLLFHTVNRFHVNNNSCNVLKSYDIRAGKCESNELGYRKTLSFYHAIYPMDIIIQSNGHNGWNEAEKGKHFLYFFNMTSSISFFCSCSFPQTMARERERPGTEAWKVPFFLLFSSSLIYSFPHKGEWQKCLSPTPTEQHFSFVSSSDEKRENVCSVRVKFYTKSRTKNT